jgi:hypothetical protein
MQDSPAHSVVVVKTGLLSGHPASPKRWGVYLGAYGSPNAEQALWKRYEAWSHEWAGRESELRFVFSGDKSAHLRRKPWPEPYPSAGNGFRLRLG